MNSLSRSDVSFLGIPWYLINRSSTKNPSCSAVNVPLHSTKCAYLVSLSIITSIVSYVTPLCPSIEGGSLVIKSIVTSSQDSTGGVLKCRLPYFVYRLDLFCWQVAYCLIYVATLVLISGNVNRLLKSCSVLPTPGWPCIGLL